MKTEREFFENLPRVKPILRLVKYSESSDGYDPLDQKSIYEKYADWLNGAWYSWQDRVPEGYVVVPCNPTEEMWGGLARHLVKYMQSHDRYCPKTLGKYINRFIGFKNIPDWLNKEIPDWESDHAFATADLGVFIYKAMIEAVEK